MADSQPTPAPLRRQHAKEYNTWKAMRNRCGNPRNASWRYYGGKGVAVCTRWQSFEAFLEDMGPAPSSAHSINRLDNSRGYEPGNCHWATAAEQQANTSKVRYVEFRGERLPILELAARFGISHTTLRARLDLLGWDLERALATPADQRYNHRTSRRGKPRCKKLQKTT